MQRPRTTALAAALALWFASTVIEAADRPAALADAERRLESGDARGAVGLLEAALAAAPTADRPAVIDQLRRAYSLAIRRAEADGSAEEAESYRENLAILDRLTRTGTPIATPVPAVPQPVPVAPQPIAVPSRPVPQEPPSVSIPRERLDPPSPSEAMPPRPPGSVPAEPGAIAPASASPPAQQMVARGQSPTLAPAPAPAARTPVADAAELPSIRTADEAFLAGRYLEAGRTYAALDRGGRLPADRRIHWAYCRAVEVLNRINAKPATEGEWAAIDAEIQAIRALSPTHWFSEYLRNLATERNRVPRNRTGALNRIGNKVVVRGSSPEEDAPPVQPFPVPVPVPIPAISWSAQPVGTPNFVVRHTEAHRALAEQVAQAAEAARATQAKRWGPAIVPASWDPRCEIVLFPTADEFSRETQQAPDSPGFSSMGMNEGRIVLRRIHLRADHPNIVKAVLPHEVTHVVLADIFPHQQIPRWADEGMAVLAEPHAEQALRAADLDEPLKLGTVFRVQDLLVMDYPKAENWALYYAQSVSVTRYLVETGSPAQFIRLVDSAQRASQVHLLGKVPPNLPPDHAEARARRQDALRAGFTDALKEVYSVASLDDLHNRWLTYARGRASDSVASAPTSESDPDKR